ncbi:MAG: AMP-binding protein, partial [Pyrinomonadaceae bacterium]|nr:AMP-binding protein [Pyrinomonadaceae bacterium]
RVILLSYNAPEWGLTYFGILKTGATVVPIDPQSSVAELVNIANKAEASAIVISQKLFDEFPELSAKLEEANLTIPVWRFDDVFEIVDEIEESNRLALLPPKVASNSVASLIFTSGTTGTPKGVMLTHKNFVNMVSMLSSVLEMDTSDGTLSVLPLHHTFEFSAGFLTPLSNGTQITYLDELSGEELASAIQNGHVTGLVGVPALWEMLHRRIKTRLREQGDFIADLADNIIEFNAWLRDKTPFNLGQIVFFPIHQNMGGRIRYLISGGSALSEKVQRDLHGLGFTILEGYGLTEAAPVLTVTRPNNLLKGSVGKPLPGVEVKIDSPDANGVGEVIARGQNVMLGYFNNDEATSEVLQDRWLKTGDLGKIDDDGNLYIVGRSKDVIIDSNGKNIYPDEIEEIYGKSSYVKELSVVGLPDENGGEKIACLVRADYEFDIALVRADVNQKIEAHFREVSASLPFFKRVKVFHFTNFELPRTATRKVKRSEIVEILQDIEQKSKKSNQLESANKADNNAVWLRQIVANVANRDLTEIRLESKLAEMSFDSLMFVELAAAIEDGGGKVLNADTFNEVQTVRELLQAVERVDKSKKVEETREVKKQPDEDEIFIPSIVREVGNRALDFVQKTFYGEFLNTKITGEMNVPPHTNFIVSSNHCSHLDMGLVKFALGDDAAKNTVAVAAADYWFDTKYKRAYMNNFTTLVPIERTGSLRQSLRHVTQILDEGYNALIFPEGTRSLTGEMSEFKPVIGYLAMACRIGILPIYVYGTYEAYPKGMLVPKVESFSKKIGAKVGKYIEFEELEAMTKGVSRNEAYRLIAARVQHEVENLRDGKRETFDAENLRKQWRKEKRAARKSANASSATNGD